MVYTCLLEYIYSFRAYEEGMGRVYISYWDCKRGNRQTLRLSSAYA